MVKENVLDVLMYLFEHYMDSELELFPDHESLRIELMDAGFSLNEIDKAFVWLEGLAFLKEQPHYGGLGASSRSVRIYTDEEMRKLGPDCRGFLLFLEEIGVLDGNNREMVIDRVLALEGGEIDLKQLKWIILMVLFNQPGLEAAFSWMEDQVFEDYAPVAH